ncbi:unnamed protein product [Brassica napus]|uniref:(rape) hypothetical protein n=1 Tax=Brassica napus TaxID=3708 RepID=A0A817AJL9_BRANA|nr:unnamed protein product [Brassica napus]
MTCRGCIWRRRWLFSTANIAAFEQTEDIIAAAVDKEDHLLGGTQGKKWRRSRYTYIGCGKSA